MVPESSHLESLVTSQIDFIRDVFTGQTHNSLDGPEGELFSYFKSLPSPEATLGTDLVATF